MKINNAASAGRIKEFRSVSRLSKEALARLLRVSARTVSRWERAEVIPDRRVEAELERLKEVAEKLKDAMPGRRLLKWLERPSPEFEGLPPIDLLRSEYGARKLNGFIEQMLHGGW